jgi:hypothetical protein
MTEISKDEFDRILEYCMMGEVQTRTRIAYDHMHKFLAISKRFDGTTWETVKKLMRISLAIDIRYIEDLKDGFLKWGIININDGILHYTGMPATDTISENEPPEIKRNESEEEYKIRVEEFKKRRKERG